jgi:hypothetical protein
MLQHRNVKRYVNVHTSNSIIYSEIVPDTCFHLYRLDSIHLNFSITMGSAVARKIQNLQTHLNTYAKPKSENTEHVNTYNYMIYSESLPDAHMCILCVFRYRLDSISLSL